MEKTNEARTSTTTTLADFCETLTSPCFNNDFVQLVGLPVMWVGSARDRVGLDEHISGLADRVMTPEALAAEMAAFADVIDGEFDAKRPRRATFTIHRGQSARNTWDLLRSELAKRDAAFEVVDDRGSRPSSSHTRGAWIELTVRYRGVPVDVIFGVRELAALAGTYNAACVNVAFGTAGIYVPASTSALLQTGTRIVPRDVYIIHDADDDCGSGKRVTLERARTYVPPLSGAVEVDLVGYESCAIFRPECLQRRLQLDMAH
jgi:hypothetical protein